MIVKAHARMLVFSSNDSLKVKAFRKVSCTRSSALSTSPVRESAYLCKLALSASSSSENRFDSIFPSSFNRLFLNKANILPLLEA